MYFKFGDACLLNPLTVVSWCLQQKLIKQGNQFTCWLAWTLVSLVSKLCCMSVAQRVALTVSQVDSCHRSSWDAFAWLRQSRGDETRRRWATERMTWTDRQEERATGRGGKNELKVNLRLKNRRNKKVESKTKSTKNLHQDRKILKHSSSNNSDGKPWDIQELHQTCWSRRSRVKTIQSEIQTSRSRIMIAGSTVKTNKSWLKSNAFRVRTKSQDQKTEGRDGQVQNFGQQVKTKSQDQQV